VWPSENRAASQASGEYGYLRTSPTCTSAYAQSSATQKWRLHESGDWRHQCVTAETAAEFGKTDGRIIDRWQQPAEMGNSGWTKGFSVRVRYEDLVEVEGSPKAPKDTFWISAPPEGRFIGLHIAIAQPSDLAVSLNGLIPLGGFALIDGRAVILGVTVGRPPTSTSRRSRTPSRNPSSWRSRTASTGLRSQLRAAL
jgi:hypothetical protein